MGDAFQCDGCGDFYEGDPVEKLYTEEIGHQGSHHSIRFELCENCILDIEEDG